MNILDVLVASVCERGYELDTSWTLFSEPSEFLISEARSYILPSFALEPNLVLVKSESMDAAVTLGHVQNFNWKRVHWLNLRFVPLARHLSK